MDIIKLLWASFKKHVWDVISQQWWLIFLIAFVWTVFSNIVVWHGKTACASPISDMQFMLFLIFTQIIFIATAHKMYFSDTPEQKKEFSFKLMTVAYGALVFMLMIFIWIMFSEYMLKLVSSWLGTECSRTETLSSIGYGMGGILAVIGASALSHRADAQVENNKLIEKGQVNDRFQHATKNLGNQEINVRIASFYQFYYLAAKNLKTPKKTQEFRESIFEILCSHLRVLSHKLPYSEEEERRCLDEECQTLLDILFKHKFKSGEKILTNHKFVANLQRAHLCGIEITSINLSYANLMEAVFANASLMDPDFSHAELWQTNFSGAGLISADFFCADLWNADLSNADLSFSNLLDANLSDANLQGAQLQDINLMEVRSIKQANFCGAKIGDRPITKDDLPADKGEYYADWNPPPEKEEN